MRVTSLMGAKITAPGGDRKQRADRPAAPEAREADPARPPPGPAGCGHGAPPDDAHDELALPAPPGGVGGTAPGDPGGAVVCDGSAHLLAREVTGLAAWWQYPRAGGRSRRRRWCPRRSPEPGGGRAAAPALSYSPSPRKSSGPCAGPTSAASTPKRPGRG